LDKTNMPYTGAGFPKTSLSSLVSFTTAGAIGTTVFMDEAVLSVGPNYCVDAGAANALTATITAVTAGVKVYPETGMKIILKTNNALQAGANTLNLNGQGTKSIKSQRSGTNARDINTTIIAGAMLEMIYDGTYWRVVGL
jgi:hypothetical protein